MVTLIPTKESVFAEYIENNTALNNSGVIDELIVAESQVNEQVSRTVSFGRRGGDFR